MQQLHLQRAGLVQGVCRRATALVACAAAVSHWAAAVVEGQRKVASWAEQRGQADGLPPPRPQCLLLRGQSS